MNELKHQIIGHDMQAVEILLAPGQTIVAEAGSMVYMEDGITFAARMGDGTEPADAGLMSTLWSAAKRSVSGAGVFLTHFTNGASVPRRVVFGASSPGKVLKLDLTQWGGAILCEHGSFLCVTQGTRVNSAFAQKLRAGAFGGAGFVLQKIEGNGTLFAHACGSVIERTLNNEVLRVEPGALVAFSTTLEYSIERAGNLKTMLFGGEGVFLATLRGTGTVILQSLPWSRVVHHIAEQAAAK